MDAPGHIVDELIEERCEHLRAMAWLWPLLRPALYQALGYEKARAMADDVARCSGFAAFAHVSGLLKLRLEIAGLAQVPERGRVVVIANHPTGLADGIAVFDALKTRRPDLMFLANADALRVIPAADDVIIPVEWVQEKRSRATARATLAGVRRALQDERCVIMFPAGKLAALTWSGLQERPWEPSAVSLARKFAAPIVPLHIRARNSALYYLFCLLNRELRDITLFHELLNKAGHRFALRFGAPLSPDGLPRGAAAANALVRRIVTRDLAQAQS